MRNKSLTLLTTVLAVIILASCDTKVKVRSKVFRDSEKWGKVVKTNLDIDEFSEIELWSSADIEFYQSDTFRIVIEGNEKAIDAYKFETVADTLEDTIPTRRLIATWNKDLYSSHTPSVRLHIYAPTLHSVQIESDGDIDLKDSVNVGKLAIRINGAGDVDIRNLECDDLDVNIQGAGDVSVKRIKANSLKASIDGAGDVHVRRATLTGNATLEVNGAGDIEGNIKGRNILASSQGAGDIDLEVECDEVTVISEGAGDVEIEGETKVLKKSRQALGTTTTKKLSAERMEYIK